MFFDVIYTLRQALYFYSASSQHGNVSDDQQFLLSRPIPNNLLAGKSIFESSREPSSYITTLHIVESKLWAGSSDGTIIVYDAVSV